MAFVGSFFFDLVDKLFDIIELNSLLLLLLLLCCVLVFWSLHNHRFLCPIHSVFGQPHKRQNQKLYWISLWKTIKFSALSLVRNVTKFVFGIVFFFLSKFSHKLFLFLVIINAKVIEILHTENIYWTWIQFDLSLSKYGKVSNKFCG